MNPNLNAQPTPSRPENPYTTLKSCLICLAIGVIGFVFFWYFHIIAWQFGIFGILAVIVARPINSWQSTLGALLGGVFTLICIGLVIIYEFAKFQSNT